MPPKKKKLNKKALLRKQEEERRLREEAFRKEQDEIRRKQEEEEIKRKEEDERIRTYENKIRKKENEELQAHLQKLSANHRQTCITMWENKRWNDYLLKSKEMDPLDIREVNSFISDWKEDDDYQVDNILQKCRVCHEMIEDIYWAVQNYPYEDLKTRNLWGEGIENLRKIVFEKMEFASFMILKDAYQHVNETSLNMEFGVRSGGASLQLWSNLYAAVRSCGMAGPGFESEFRLPKFLVEDPCAVRVMHISFLSTCEASTSKAVQKDVALNQRDETTTHQILSIKDTKKLCDELKENGTYDKEVDDEKIEDDPNKHYGNATKAESFKNGNNNKNENLKTKIKEEDRFTEKEENTINILNDEENKGNNLYTDENSETILNTGENTKSVSLNRIKIDEITNQDVATIRSGDENTTNSRNFVENQEKSSNADETANDNSKNEEKIMDNCCTDDEGSKSDQHIGKMNKETQNESVVTPVKETEYFMVGGVIHFDYLEVPKLTVRQKGVTFIYRENVKLQRREYHSKLQDEDGALSSCSPDDTEYKSENPEKKKASIISQMMFLKLQLPESVIWHDKPHLARFNDETKAFCTGEIFDDKYDSNMNQISFHTKCFGIFGMFQKKHANLPYKGWRLCGGEVSKLTLDGQYISLTIEVTNQGFKLSELNPRRLLRIEELGSSWRTVEELIQKLLSFGINIASFNNSPYIGLQSKNESLENAAYDSMSLASANMEFSWSRWNRIAENDEIILNVKPAKTPSQVGNHLVLLNLSRVIELKCTEENENFSKEPVESNEFTSTLFHFVSKTFPETVNPSVNVDDSSRMWNVQSLLRCCRPLSCS